MVSIKRKSMDQKRGRGDIEVSCEQSFLLFLFPPLKRRSFQHKSWMCGSDEEWSACTGS